MRVEAVGRETEQAAFELFHSFSRFEFALKEVGWLASKRPGSKAKPDWSRFVSRWETEYRLSDSSRLLIEARPKFQSVSANGETLEFVDVEFDLGTTDLRRTIDLCHVVRNNLFHGGKHDTAGWDDPKRICHLAALVVAILSEVAVISGLDSEYFGIY